MKTCKNWTLVAIIAFLGIIVCFTACPPDDNENNTTHTHNFGIIWMSNAIQHWHECSCGEKSDIANHTWENWIQTEAPTIIEEGEETRTCSICEKTEKQSIPKLIEQPQFRETMINFVFNEISYSVTVQGTLLNSKWDGVADTIETAINAAYDAGNGPTKNRFRNVLSDTPTIIIELTSEFADYKLIACTFNILYLNINALESLQSIINFAFTAMYNRTPTIGHDWGDWAEINIGVETRICQLCNETNNRCTLSIGDTGPAGGIIFYLSEVGFTVQGYGNPEDEGYFSTYTAHYLESAPSDMVDGLEWASPEYYSTSVVGTEQAIGTGRRNTTLILALDINAPAAKACAEYMTGELNDWFLPSRNEIQQLYTNRAVVPDLKTVSPGDYYWASTQRSDLEGDSAWNWVFSSGAAGTTWKNNTRSVRAVRAF